MNTMIQLPDGVISQGYKQTKPFHYEQVFFCKCNNFTGTETEFVEAGLAYRYYELGDYKRMRVE